MSDLASTIMLDNSFQTALQRYAHENGSSAAIARAAAVIASSTSTDSMSALLASKDAEIARLRADAERYRWLRDETEWEPFDSAWLHKVDIYGCASTEMDAAIDAALAAQAKGGEHV